MSSTAVRAAKLEQPQGTQLFLHVLRHLVRLVAMSRVAVAGRVRSIEIPPALHRPACLAHRLDQFGMQPDQAETRALAIDPRIEPGDALTDPDLALMIQ